MKIGWFFSLKYGDLTIFKMADVGHLELYGPRMDSLKSPRSTSCSKLVSFWENCVLCTRQTDEQTNEHMSRAAP